MIAVEVTSRLILQLGVEHGIGWIDTAPAHGCGHSESLLVPPCTALMLLNER
jgi:aryl-alcohol dehydrogenase-like predicted oxidoreductase